MINKKSRIFSCLFFVIMLLAANVMGISYKTAVNTAVSNYDLSDNASLKTSYNCSSFNFSKNNYNCCMQQGFYTPHKQVLNLGTKHTSKNFCNRVKPYGYEYRSFQMLMTAKRKCWILKNFLIYAVPPKKSSCFRITPWGSISIPRSEKRCGISQCRVKRRCIGWGRYFNRFSP